MKTASILITAAWLFGAGTAAAQPPPVPGRVCVSTCDSNGTCTRGCDPGASGGSSGGSSGYTPPTIQGAVMNGVQAGIQQGFQRFFEEMFKPEDPAVVRERARQRQLEQAKHDEEMRIYFEQLRIREEARQARERAEIARKDGQAAKMVDVVGEVGTHKSDQDLFSEPAPKPSAGIKVPEHVVESETQAITCAVGTILEQARSLKLEGELASAKFQTSLEGMKQELAKPLSGSDQETRIQVLSLDVAKQKGADARELIGQVLLVRNEHTGEVHLDVMQASTRRAGFLSRLFGHPLKQAASQNIIHLDGSGNIVEKDVTGPVKKCLAARK